jgi:hypothetical protein
MTTPKEEKKYRKLINSYAAYCHISEENIKNIDRFLENLLKDYFAGYFSRSALVAIAGVLSKLEKSDLLKDLWAIYVPGEKPCLEYENAKTEAVTEAGCWLASQGIRFWPIFTHFPLSLIWCPPVSYDADSNQIINRGLREVAKVWAEAYYTNK